MVGEGYLVCDLTDCSVSRVLAHYTEVSLLLEDRPDFPEELQGAKKGVLYLTQYKVRA